MQDGRNIYSGPISAVEQYFLGLGVAPASTLSVVEWIVDITAKPTNTITKEAQANMPAIDFQQSYAESDGPAYLRKLSQVLSNIPQDTFVEASDVRKPSLCHSVFTLTAHRTLASWMSSTFLGPRIGEKVFASLLLTGIYYDIGQSSNPKDIQSTAGGLYFIVAQCAYGAAAFTPSLVLDRPVFYREIADGFYSPTAYYIAKATQEGTTAVLTSLLFCTITYLSLSLQGQFLVYFVVHYLTSMIGIVLAYCVAACVHDLGAANALLPAYVTVCMYYGGLFILWDQIPDWMAWLGYTTFIRYAFNALLLNQFDGYTNGEIKMYTNADSVGETVLEFYGGNNMFTQSLWIPITFLVGLTVFWGGCGLWAINKLQHVSR